MRWAGRVEAVAGIGRCSGWDRSRSMLVMHG